jgi:cyclophilin family peptidyl-prolyl cis-trans isomerase
MKHATHPWRTRIAAIALACAAVSFARADQDPAFEQAHQEYSDGHFQEAIKSYESLVASGQWSANLFYDLGNAWFRMGDFGQAILNYERALARIGKPVRATVNTSRGSFVILLLPDEAPLTVDNFVQLARKGYFNGQAVPRVVPNFVIQTGDPRGDQNGGPGYQIRCEINQAPYERGAVGMALSGKDTGGSQWFVTHSPQPHLDGGYTVFGRVIRGMEVVDSIVRGDTIVRVVVNER